MRFGKTQHSNRYPSRNGEVQLLDEGRTIAFHSGQTALVLYTPKRFCAEGDAESLKLRDGAIIGERHNQVRRNTTR